MAKKGCESIIIGKNLCTGVRVCCSKSGIKNPLKMKSERGNKGRKSSEAKRRNRNRQRKMRGRKIKQRKQGQRNTGK